MKLSTKARHAITAMMDLALNDKVRPVTLAEISQSQGISLSYLEQLFAKLRKSGLVIGVRGPGGGYKLSRVPSEISVAQIISSIDEYRPNTNQQVSAEPNLEKKYVTHVLWEELSEKIYDFLNGITLAEFANRPEFLEAGVRTRWICRR
ncbi:MAG: Rrf2 family transcriptional regulator [Gammaproteobacteria bacterium]|nr:Rrf2 family transcriptional regulator [Gammaproteobacteria bacterium]